MVNSRGKPCKHHPKYVDELSNKLDPEQPERLMAHVTEERCTVCGAERTVRREINEAHDPDKFGPGLWLYSKTPWEVRS